MNFARAKTILIFIFVFVNIFLLLIYNLFILEKKEVDIDTLIQVLDNNNISVDEKLIEDYKDTLPAIEVINRVNNHEEITSDFLGKEYEKKEEGVYENEKGRLALKSFDSEFTVKNPGERKYRDLNILNAGNKILNTLSKFGFEKENLSVYSVDENANGNFYVSVAYIYDSVPVFNHSLTAVATHSGFKSLKGSAMSFVELKNQDYSIISVSDVLLEFINNKDLINNTEKTVVTGIKLGYYLPTEEFEVSTYAIPAYEIKLETGRIYYYDARKNVDSSFKLLGSKIGNKV